MKPETHKPGASGRAVPAWLLTLLVLALIGAGAIWRLERMGRPATPPPAPPSEDAKAYVQHLKLSDWEMKATETYLKQTLVEITGKITNTGDRRLKSVEITCVFYDPYGQVVLRERTPIVRARSGGLAPGETKNFRLPFDNVPESWNQAMPQLVIAQIEFD